MIRVRPAHVVFGALALAGLGKAGEFLASSDGVIAPGSAMQSVSFVAPAAAATETVREAAASPAEVKAAPADPELCASPEEIFGKIQQERALLEEQRNALADREAKLDLGREQLAVETQELMELKGMIETLLGRVDSAQKADVERLVALYRNMKPKDAAVIMNDLDIGVSVLVMATMPERDAAPIMANLDPVRARAISKILIERSKLPGDQNFNGLRLR